MLREISHVLQQNGKLKRRWFMSSYFDLVVSFQKDDYICEFELCYGHPSRDNVLRWSERFGFRHQKIDHGEHNPLRHKMTPLYLEERYFDKTAVLERFTQESQGLDPKIALHVIEKLSTFE